MGRPNRGSRRDAQSLGEEEKKEPFSLLYSHHDEEQGTAVEADDVDIDSQNNDPYSYSDDSASLSDAYFFPQSDDGLARPLRYRRELEPLNKPPIDLHVPTPALRNYGAIHGQENKQTPLKQYVPPLWFSGAIHEEKEHLMAPPNTYSDHSKNEIISGVSGPTSNRKQRQRKGRRGRIKQIKAGAREQKVNQVKGRPQSMKQSQDLLFAIVFVLQLVVVVLVAVYFLRSTWNLRMGPRTAEVSDSTAPPVGISTGNDKLDRSLTPSRRQIRAQEESYTVGDPHQEIDSPASTTARAHELWDMGLGSVEYHSILAVLCVDGLYACILAHVSFGFMLIFIRALIPLMLIVSVLLTLAWGLVGMSLDPYGFISILGFAALSVTLTYTIYNWSRIPFAATNLHTSLSALRCTADVTILGLGSLVVSLLWCMVWSVAFVGTVKALKATDDKMADNGCDISKQACETQNPVLNDVYFQIKSHRVLIYLLLFVSLHWTNSVIKNIVRTTVASAIGSWWYYPQDISFLCSPAVGRPLMRSITKSLGSICLGSLVIPIAQFLSTAGSATCCLVGSSECFHQARKDATNSTSGHVDTLEVDSAADSMRLGSRICRLMKCMELSVRACNRWSFTYVGLYGYSFREAGERALVLFETREWLDVVSDNLIQNILSMASAIIGGSTGVFAVFVEETDGLYFPSLHMPITWAFLIGFILGYTLSNTLLLGVVGSAVNTVLVCFAAGPFEFDKNHPQLSREMREVWSQQVWSLEG